jgi:hypothetical protein
MIQNNNSNYGFITIPILVAILFASALVGGGSYYVVKSVSESDKINEESAVPTSSEEEVTNPEPINATSSISNTVETEVITTESRTPQQIKPSVVPTTPVIVPETKPVPVVQEQVQVDIPPEYLNPDGSLKTPEQIAAEIVEELKKQNSTDDYDPYGVLSDGTAYTPEQLDAINCAYYGRNCPTLYIVE